MFLADVDWWRSGFPFPGRTFVDVNIGRWHRDLDRAGFHTTHNLAIKMYPEITEEIAMKAKSSKTSYLGTSPANIIYTPLRCSSWPNANMLYLLIANLTAVWCKQYMTSHMMSKLSVNMAYICTHFVIIMQLSFVRQGWCFPTYFHKFA